MADDWAPLRATIRNAVIHLMNEQPLLADLFQLPSVTDLGLLCTNLRTLAGKRPVFADNVESTFFFPYHVVRFVEIQPGSSGPDLIAAPQQTVQPAADPSADLDIDEDFLRRVREA